VHHARDCGFCLHHRFCVAHYHRSATARLRSATAPLAVAVSFSAAPHGLLHVYLFCHRAVGCTTLRTCHTDFTPGYVDWIFCVTVCRFTALRLPARYCVCRTVVHHCCRYRTTHVCTAPARTCYAPFFTRTAAPYARCRRIPPPPLITG